MISGNPLNFNVTVKNLGSITDWMQNTLTATDINNLVDESTMDPTKFGVAKEAKTKLMGDYDVITAATKIVDSNDNNKNLTSAEKNEKINEIKQQIVNQVTSNDNFKTLINLYNGKRPDPLMLKDLGIKEIKINGKKIDISNIDFNPKTKMIGFLVEQFLTKKYNDVQAIAAPKLAADSDVFLLCEFNTKIPPSRKPQDIMHVRPETREIANKGDYELHYCTEMEAPDAVIAIPKGLFKNIENQSFLSSTSADIDVACVTATHKNSKKKCMFISAHVPGFAKEDFVKWKGELPKREQALDDAKKEHGEKWGEDVKLTNSKGFLLENRDLNTEKQKLEKEMKNSDLSTKDKNKIKSKINVIDKCLAFVEARTGMQGVATGDNLLKEIGERARLFKADNPKGVVVFGGDLNTSKEIYEGRHGILEEAGLTVAGSGKATNIQSGDEKTAHELDFAACSTTNSLSGKKIAEFKIKKDETADKFNAMEETSDHKQVVAHITLFKSVSKIQKIFNGFLSLLSLISLIMQRKKVNVTSEQSAPNLLEHKVTSKVEFHEPTAKKTSTSSPKEETDARKDEVDRQLQGLLALPKQSPSPTSSKKTTTAPQPSPLEEQINVGQIMQDLNGVSQVNQANLEIMTKAFKKIEGLKQELNDSYNAKMQTHRSSILENKSFFITIKPDNAKPFESLENELNQLKNMDLTGKNILEVAKKLKTLLSNINSDLDFINVELPKLYV
jgi:hypothetical protein